MIIISRCPYRISLLGGGSDLDWFVKENNYGICLGYSLSKYTYTVINKLPSRAKRGILNYSSREEYSNVNEILKEFIETRLNYYILRKQHLVKILDEDIKFLNIKLLL